MEGFFFFEARSNWSFYLLSKYDPVISGKSYTETSKLFERKFNCSVFLKEVPGGSVIGLPNLKTYVDI